MNDANRPAGNNSRKRNNGRTQIDFRWLAHSVPVTIPSRLPSRLPDLVPDQAEALVIGSAVVLFAASVAGDGASYGTDTVDGGQA